MADSCITNDQKNQHPEQNLLSGADPLTASTEAAEPGKIVR
jgi:hypothetical protein